MPINYVSRPLVVVALFVLSCLPSLAQQTPPSPTSSTPAPSQSQKKEDQAHTDQQGQSKPGEIIPGSSSTQGKVAGTSNDRLFYALPNFLSLENAGNVPPLTTGEKFRVVARGSFDYIQIPWYGFLSGISQAEDSEPGYGQGAEGYGKRIGSAFADGTIENFMTGAIFPSILHQDPRFFQSGKGSFLHRTGYAISRSFVTRTDSGHSQFNFSEIVGGALSAAISTYSYHPKSFTSTHYNQATGMLTYEFHGSDRTLINTASVWGTQLGYDTMTLVVKEFWPDIHRKLNHKYRPQAGPAPNTDR